MKAAMILAAVGAFLAFSALAQQDGKEKVLYRYTNEHGVEVLNDQLPPCYVGGGYKVITVSGRLLRVVHPQLSGKQLAEKQRLQAQSEVDYKLLQRYSNLTDIESARARKLAAVQQDIAIINANIFSLNNQIDSEESTAARTQRNGARVVSERLARIASLHTEKQIVQQRLQQRKKEALQTNAEFDQTVERYEEIANQ